MSSKGQDQVKRHSAKILQWSATALAVTGLAVSPAIARMLTAADLSVSLSDRGTIGSFTPTLVDPDLLAQYQNSALKNNKGFRFTPAGADTDKQRAITVVVRQSGEARAIGVREGAVSANAGTATLAAKLNPTKYNLGAAKGWKSFALPEKALPVKNFGGKMPDLSEFNAAEEGNGKAKDSRFSARLSVDASTPTGSAPRALDDSQRDVSVDVGGSYALTRNLNVTAGVRLNNERDRMAPLTDSRQDSQAVYVGTQFRF